MMKIKEYEHDDEELLDAIKHLMGSDVWQQEHGQQIRRQKGRKFYLMWDEDRLVCMRSIYKHHIRDAHTMPEYRHKGYMTEFTKYICENYCEDYLIGGTKNPIMRKVYLNCGFVPHGMKGQYEYFIYRRSK